MGVDVLTETDIARPPADVFAYAADPDNVPQWYANIKRVEWKTPKPLALGSRIAFVAKFMFGELEYTYEIIELVPAQRLVMRAATGPFPMQTMYTFAPNGNGGTHMTLRNEGDPNGLPGIFSPFVASAMRKANRKDLALLKRILEKS